MHFLFKSENKSNTQSIQAVHGQIQTEQTHSTIFGASAGSAILGQLASVKLVSYSMNCGYEVAPFRKDTDDLSPERGYMIVN